MEHRKLGGTDLRLSILGFGSSPLGGAFGRIDPAEAARAVHLAVDRGINFFDSSPYYGQTLAESRLGEALKGRRQKIVLATKCGRYGLDDFDFSAERVATSLDESLRRLQTDYVDLFQVHDLEFGDAQQIIEETLPAMRRLQQQGKVRYIGITGYPLKVLRRVAEGAAVDSILSYCHYNLMNIQMDEVLTTFARECGIGLINAAVLHMGVLTEAGAPTWHPAPQEVKDAGRNAAQFCSSHGLDIADVALRFSLDHPYVSSTLVGMGTTQEVEASLKVLENFTDVELLLQLQETIAPAFNRTWPSGRPENQD